MNSASTFSPEAASRNAAFAPRNRVTEQRHRLFADLLMFTLLLLTLTVVYSTPLGAQELPDYTKLVREQRAAVVRVTALSPTPTSSTRMASSSRGCPRKYRSSPRLIDCPGGRTRAPSRGAYR